MVFSDTKVYVALFASIYRSTKLVDPLFVYFPPVFPLFFFFLFVTEKMFKHQKTACKAQFAHQNTQHIIQITSKCLNEAF